MNISTNYSNYYNFFILSRLPPSLPAHAWCWLEVLVASWTWKSGCSWTRAAELHQLPHSHLANCPYAFYRCVNVSKCQWLTEFDSTCWHLFFCSTVLSAVLSVATSQLRRNRCSMDKICPGVHTFFVIVNWATLSRSVSRKSETNQPWPFWVCMSHPGWM